MNLNEFKDRLSELNEGIFIEEEVQVSDINTFISTIKEGIINGSSFIDEELSDSTILGIIPDELPLPVADNLTFSNFVFINATKERETHISFTINWPGEWEILKGFFTIREIEITVEVTGGEAEALLIGIVDFKGYELKATVELPSLYLELKLLNTNPDSNRPSPLGLLKKNGPIGSEEDEFIVEPPGNPDGDSAILLSQFQIRSYPLQKNYIIDFGMDNLPLYDDKFYLDFDTTFVYNDGDVSGGFWTNFKFEGIKNTPSFSIPIEAEFSESGKSMRFAGGLSLKDYDLSDVVKMIGNKFDKNLDFPSFSNAENNVIRINYLALGLTKNGTNYDFDFEIDILNLIRIAHNQKTIFLLEELFVQISYATRSTGEKDFEANIKGYLNLLGHKLSAEATKDKSGWAFTAKTAEEESLELLDWLSDLLETGTELELPKGLEGFSLTNAEIAYHTGTKAFSIKGESAGELEIAAINNTIKELKFSYSRNELQETSILFSGVTSIEYETGKSVDINVDISYKDGSWFFEGRTGTKEIIFKDGSWIFDEGSGLEEDLELGKMLKGIFSVQAASKLPDVITEFKAKRIGIKYESKFKKFNLSAFIETKDFPAKGVNAGLVLDFNYSGSPKTLGVSGKMIVEDPNGIENHQFLLAFGKAKEGNTFLASYHGSVTFQKVVGLFNSGLSESLPKWITPEMNGATFLITKNSDGESRVIFLLEGDIEFKLSDLDLVGKHLPKEPIKVELKMNIATGALPKAEVASVQKLLADTGSSLVIPKDGQGQGFSLKTNITGSSIIPPNTGFTFEKIKKASGQSSDEGKEPESKTQWIDASKKFGPVFIKKIGVTLEEGKFKLLIDGGMSMGGFTFRLMDLAVRVPLSMPFDPKGIDFSLAGLELKYKTATASLSGAFLAQKVLYRGRLINGYFGEAALVLNDKSFKAIGSFINIPDNPSFFLYVVATLPIGGPKYFYVNGFALGFGINSHLNIPEIDGVRDFVLVKAAFDEAQFSDEVPESNLQLIQQDISPEVGSYWVAIGLKVMHVKILQSFFLATIEFGNRVEINLLGLTKLVLPPPGNSIVKAELAIKAKYVPDTGVLSIEGRLTKNSYIFSPDARLTGGFAFFAWFKGEHAGDFVLSMGGYHPKFKKPPHYPSVPRLGLSWQVTSNILIKGGEYYALTPNYFMAGGRLEATASVGPIEAWFIAEAHFIINFSPFHYEANVMVAMGATFELDLGLITIRKTMSFSSSLDLWGPPFAGRAVIDLGIIDFVIEFGPEKERPKPISWAKFREQFLPPKDRTLLIDVSNGFIKDVSQDEFAQGLDWILNPSEMILSIESGIPVKSIQLGNNAETSDSAIGIAPMKLVVADFKSEMQIEVFRGEVAVTDDFLFSGTNYRNEPKALWGTFMDDKKDGEKALVKDSLAGTSIHPQPKIPAISVEFEVKDLIYGDPVTGELNVQEGFITENKYADLEPTDKNVSSPFKKHITAFKNLGLILDEPNQFTFSDEDDQWMEADITHRTTGSIA